jgi:hypothetical protein
MSAPEAGRGAPVYKTRLRYKPGIFTYNGQCIECVGQDLMKGNSPPTQCSSLPRPATGLAILAQTDVTKVCSGGTLQKDVNFWDGPYALAAYDPSTETEGPGSGFTYIRFRHDIREP